MRGMSHNTSRMMTGSVNPTAKKLVIKPFAVQPKLPQNFFEETWVKLKDAVVSVYEKNASALSKEELYRAVEDLCVHKYSQQLYDELSRELRVHIQNRVVEMQANVGIDSKDFLTVVEQTWNNFSDQLNTVRNVFLYLDRSFACKGQQGVKSIWDLGLSICRQTMDTMPELQTKIVNSIIEAVNTMRTGDNSQKDTLSHGAQMMISLDLYVNLLEPSLLEDSRRFFSEEGQHAVVALDAARFLALVERRLNEANELCTQSLDLRSKRALSEIIENLLLKPHIHALLERESGGFKTLVEEDKRDDLRRMCTLFEKIGALDLLKASFALVVRQSGESVIATHIPAPGSAPAATPLSEKEFVESLLLLLNKVDGIMRVSFGNRDAFALALKLSFENILNLHQRQTAEQLARYVDKKMRGEKGVGEAEIEAQLDQVLKLFKFLQEKDLFEAFYKKYLSKRLLLSKSASHEVEKSILAKLKAECGPGFTAKLEGMFADMELSKQCTVSYQNHLRPVSETIGAASSSVIVNRVLDTVQQREYVEPELSLLLLTAGNWPTAPSCASLKIPAEIKSLMRRFEQFYHGSYQGRKLVWSHSLERCVVSARFTKGKKDLDVSFYQALVLRCFNGAEQLTLPEILQQTGIETEELRRTLASLACGMIGTRVLTKDPKGKDVADTDVFSVNLEFTNKLFRIKINTIQAKEEVNEETQKTLEEVARDRTYLIDAAVVRVMKSRKRLTHSLLISEVMSQLRFPSTNADIKKRIESLIERDYLERDPDDNAFYKYLA